MSCCIENEGAKLKVTLTFGREQLLYDIKNNAYVESHVMAPETEHAKHMVADVGEEGNVDRVTRVLDLGISMCREMLYPWSKKEIGAPDKPCGVGRADANPKLLLNDT